MEFERMAACVKRMQFHEVQEEKARMKDFDQYTLLNPKNALTRQNEDMYYCYIRCLNRWTANNKTGEPF